MVVGYDEIAGAAIALSGDDRERLVELLIGTLDAENAVGLDDALRETLRRRSDDIDAGAVELVDWSIVRNELRNRRRGHG